jgi:hypothetical protein
VFDLAGTAAPLHETSSSEALAQAARSSNRTLGRRKIIARQLSWIGPRSAS